MDADTASDAELVDKPEADTFARRLRFFVRGLLITLYLLAVAWICTTIWWSEIFRGLAASQGPNSGLRRADARQWVEYVAANASSAVDLAILAAVLVAVSSVLCVIAAWRRSRIWLSTTVLGGAALLGTLVFLGTMQVATSQQAVGTALANLDASSPERESAASGESSPAPVEAPVPGVGEARTEMERMITAVGAKSGEDPIETATCEAVGTAPEGARLSVRFSVAGDEDGGEAERVLRQFRGIGYSVVDGIRSERFLQNPGQPLLDRVSVNDRSTIDGQLWITLESRCSDPAR